MDSRYIDKNIVSIFLRKHELWQETEIAALWAWEKYGSLPKSIAKQIENTLREKEIDFDLINKFDEEFHHDLNAFIAERRRHLPSELAHYLHKGLTSYDTEEPAFARMLKVATEDIECVLKNLLMILESEAQKYRYTIMLARTHGQEAKLQTHGKRLLTWYVQLKTDLQLLRNVSKSLEFSKMSGAIGVYGDFTPEMEEYALSLMGFKPFYGATQIMPREIYVPVASALVSIVGTICKISDDIRLGSRSGNAIYQEPFKKTQMGSSAMPHKKNTIRTEQMEGMFRMAKGYLSMIMDNIKTWEERAIEQSCVERVAWPDLFHVTAHSIKTITKLIARMKVFPDRMYQEIIGSRGCYASDEAKNFLGVKLPEHGFSAEDAYRIVQLAAENAHNPGEDLRKVRRYQPKSLVDTEKLFEIVEEDCFNNNPIDGDSIEDIILNGRLVVSPDLKAEAAQVTIWNKSLEKVFSDDENKKMWSRLFKPAYLLRHEPFLFEKVFGN